MPLRPYLFNLAINCKVVSVLCKGEENPLVRAKFFPFPYDPLPFSNAAKGVSPLETPAFAGTLPLVLIMKVQGSINNKLSSLTCLSLLSAVMSCSLFSIAVAAMIASGSFILYVRRKEIVLFFTFSVKNKTWQSCIKDRIRSSSKAVIPEKERSSISEITERPI